jgi:hypothetical protein
LSDQRRIVAPGQITAAKTAAARFLRQAQDRLFDSGSLRSG